MKKISYTIKDKNGIHARPAGMIVQAAKEYSSSVELKLGDKTADAKKLFRVMQLGARFGDEIELIIVGEDEEEAETGICSMLERAGL